VAELDGRFTVGETVSYTTDAALTIGTTPVAVPLDTVVEATLAGRLLADLGGTTAHRFGTSGYKTVTVTATDCPVGGDGLTVDVKVGGVSRVSWSGPYGHRLDAETLRIGKVGAGVDVTVELSSAGSHTVDDIQVTFEHVDVGAAVVNEQPSAGVSLGENYSVDAYSAAVWKNLSLSGTEVAAGQLLICVMSHVRINDGICGGPSDGATQVVAGGTLVTAAGAYLGSCRYGNVSVFSLIATADHVANGIDYQHGGIGHGEGRIQILPLSGYSAVSDSHDVGFGSDARTVGPLAGGNFTLVGVTQGMFDWGYWSIDPARELLGEGGDPSRGSSVRFWATDEAADTCSGLGSGMPVKLAVS